MLVKAHKLWVISNERFDRQRTKSVVSLILDLSSTMDSLWPHTEHLKYAALI